MQLQGALAAGPPRTAMEEADQATLEELADRALVLSGEMNFEFLYDAQRGLFAIGYRLADAEGPGRFDPSYYDLLASEARLASFLAIARGDVPQDVVSQERKIQEARAKESGKPAEIAAKMVEGAVNKFLGEISLLGQPFIKDDKQTVEKMLAAKKAKVHGYAFLVVGEGIEKTQPTH